MIRKFDTKKGVRWGYVIELGKVNGERKRMQKRGFITKNQHKKLITELKQNLRMVEL
ncbi:hypothetical protein [Sebaldella sp. S0638]|uniref:hypothetical protein n=1 Tax=Sebaldella sp. S0638 TaxID=2957809 RepID=UPI0020A11CF9|nr:hypothetical protein [Sebaldella sp. S0638]MCP1226606.1 hypothetical protein [Sebaldella sp. S0638]